jgi:hypothetical protein
MKSLVLTLLLLGTTAFGVDTTPAPAPTPPPPAREVLEPIHLFKISNGLLSIGVWTSGYTGEGYFRIDVRKTEGERSHTLRIVRIKRDEGKMMPQPIVLTYKLADLKIDPRLPVRVENAFSDAED